MTIAANGWLDWTVHAPGIPDKTYSEPNRGIGLIGHSIVGSYQAAIGRFMSEQRDAAGWYTPYAAASVMFIACQDGEIIQCYPVTASTWTSGGREANTSYWAIEAEGGAPGNEREPLTDAQVAGILRLCREWEAAHPGEQVRPGTTFREHGEIARQFGYSATACPSNRYQRLYEALEDDMDEAKVLEIIAADLERRRLAGPGISTLERVETFVEDAFTAAQGAKTIKGLRKALHPDGPQP